METLEKRTLTIKANVIALPINFDDLANNLESNVFMIEEQIYHAFFAGMHKVPQRRVAINIEKMELEGTKPYIAGE